MKLFLVILHTTLALPALELKKQRIGFKWNLKNVSFVGENKFSASFCSFLLIILPFEVSGFSSFVQKSPKTQFASCFCRQHNNSPEGNLEGRPSNINNSTNKRIFLLKIIDQTDCSRNSHLATVRY